jgi:hypothetical protein
MGRFETLAASGLGYQCMYGAFDEFIINPKDIDKLKDIIHYLKK